MNTAELKLEDLEETDNTDNGSSMFEFQTKDSSYCNHIVRREKIYTLHSAKSIFNWNDSNFEF